MIIFKHREVSDIYVYKEVEGLLDRTYEIFQEHDGERLTEQQLLDFVDRAYLDYDVTENESYIKGLKIYKDIQEQYNYILDNLSESKVFTREGLDTISVIPVIFKERLKNASIPEKSSYEIDVREKRVSDRKRYTISSDKDGFRYLDNVEYSKEKGLEFLD